jgi:hypothetical protein
MPPLRVENYKKRGSSIFKCSAPSAEVPVRGLWKDSVPASSDGRGEEMTTWRKSIYQRFEKMKEGGATEEKLQKFAARSSVRGRRLHKPRLSFE